MLAPRARNDDPLVGEDNLVSNEVIAGKPVAGGEERVASPEQEPAHAALALASPDDGAAVPLQHGIRVFPLGPGAHARRLGGRVVLGLFQVAQVDRHAAVDVVAARPVHVAPPPRAHGERLPGIGQRLYGRGHLGGEPRLQDARGFELRVVAPVGAVPGDTRGLSDTYLPS